MKRFLVLCLVIWIAGIHSVWLVATARFKKTMKKFLFLLLLLLPMHAQAARLYVSANSDCITPSQGLIQGGSWTLAIWFKLASLPGIGGQYVLFNDGSGTNLWNPLVYYENAAGTKHIRTITCSTFGIFHISDWNVNLNTGQWYHLALMSGDRGGTNVYLIYLDGVSQTWTAGGTYVSEANNGGAPRIGCGDAGTNFGFFDGTIAEIGRWAANSSSATTANLSNPEIIALSRGARPEKVHLLPASGTPRQYVWRLEGWQTTEPDIGPLHTTPATVTGAVRANGPPVVPRW